ncbi:DUF6909 family protein [Lewinella cohaerens]|uniref:DUF6909 family protein n=1 Tax=Lewinella cohaerens TaxID=70995 RepID=UPI0003676922|nr:hypothetical protein [Lewinella cohaerens]
MSLPIPNRNRAQISRAAIERLYIAMRHLFIRGSYKPLGVSGEAMIEALRELRPEIYGSVNEPERVELNGLFYIFQRLPKGIEECRFVKLISREGYEQTDFTPIVPPARRRNAYRIDKEEMYIEMTRGRSDIYDILTHLTFMYIESEKIRTNSENHRGEKRREWNMLEEIVKREEAGEEYNREVAYTYLSTLLGRTYQETITACERFDNDPNVNSIFHITYWLGCLSSQEDHDKKDREISFSSTLRDMVGHHLHGSRWAHAIKEALHEHNMNGRPLHIISANLHSVMNCLYAEAALPKEAAKYPTKELFQLLSLPENGKLRQRVTDYARQHGMVQLDDTSGTNISVQFFDLSKIKKAPRSLEWKLPEKKEEVPVVFVMDYAFGEQAYETMDELLRPHETVDYHHDLPVASVNIMGKAGILEGGKGDIMVPSAHVFEGTADNYPFKNDLCKDDFENDLGIGVLEGLMITVLGTSLQNRDILRYFRKSSWQAIGLEMEGAHYQKAIQAASKIRHSVNEDVVLRYAYYASDNPLETGSTLASGSLGLSGVAPTYMITRVFLNKILAASR